ncbi:MAG: ion transporter [Bacillota bacterium]|nr:ion transporter [Bacillota bacterium]
MRKKIFNTIEPSAEDNFISKIYDTFMILTILVSIFPLLFKIQYPVFKQIDCITVMVFIIDYIMRFLTADFKIKSKGISAFFIYPFTPMAIIDLISILPSVTMLNASFRLLRLFRMFRTLRVFRTFKFIRYSKNVTIVMNVLEKQKKSLFCVGTLAITYIFASAIIVFNIEPKSFKTFFDAVYWATVSLTTVGYGDIYPVTTAGRIVTMISSIFGVAIVALPAGIVTAGYMEEIQEDKEKQ